MIRGLAITPADMMHNVPQQCIGDTNSIDLGPCWIVDALLSQWMPPLQRNLHSLDFLQVTHHAMNMTRWGYPHDPRKVEIHTDGATSEGPAGWANIVLIKDCVGCTWCPGFRNGKVSTRTNSMDYLGPPKHTSSAAELTGITWAMMHALQFVDYNCPIEI